jgi:hypothetical protein
VGCILDACRLAGTAPRTVYRHQENDPRFMRHCQIALKMAGYSENLLRLLLQGSNPKKYGPRPGFRRKRMLRHERKQMEREIKADIAAEARLGQRSFGSAVESVLGKIAAIERHEEPKKLAADWTKSPGGDWIPPGYAPIPGWTPPADPDGEGPPGDSM